MCENPIELIEGKDDIESLANKGKLKNVRISNIIRPESKESGTKLLFNEDNTFLINVNGVFVEAQPNIVYVWWDDSNTFTAIRQDSDIMFDDDTRC